jgi:hypothetical protein
VECKGFSTMRVPFTVATPVPILFCNFLVEPFHVKQSLSTWHLPPQKERKKEKKKPSQTHENDQATMKTRYCGHLYSPLLRKWTHLDQRGWVSYCMREGRKEPEGMLAGSVGGPCRVSSRFSSLGFKGCSEFACLFSRPFALDG